MPTCFFIGHKNAPEELYPLLLTSIKQHITEFGVENFIVGDYGNFDQLATRALLKLKKQHPEIILTLLLAYHPFYTAQQHEIFDASFYPPDMEFVPKRAAIIRANQYMINHCDYLIAYNNGHIGNTRKLLQSADRRQKRGLLQIENLAEQLFL